MVTLYMGSHLNSKELAIKKGTISIHLDCRLKQHVYPKTGRFYSKYFHYILAQIR